MDIVEVMQSLQDVFHPYVTIQNFGLLSLATLVILVYLLKLRRQLFNEHTEVVHLSERNEHLENELNAGSIITNELNNTIEAVRLEKEALKARFKNVVDADQELAEVSAKKDKLLEGITSIESDYKKKEESLKRKLVTEKTKNTKALNKLKSDYKKKKNVFDKLVKQAAIYDEEIELAELGFYKPKFDFDTSEQYKKKIGFIKDKQKKLVKSKEAIFCTTEWTIEGSVTRGKAQTNKNIRLTARAFNNECNDAISGVKWNNAERMGQRLLKAYEAINKLNKDNHIYISEDYLQLKIDELNLAYEYQQKKQEERDKQATLRQRLREEERLKKDAEIAYKEEQKYLKLLEQAKTAAENSTGKKLDDLKKKIQELNEELSKAHEKSERAKSMAEQTRAGYVYVISNIGSFGENVFKIGMTRRLEPYDRVRELGDASVPFTFDVHAMIYSDDAPTLESSLHREFDSKRINMVNSRKEFFYTNIDELEETLSQLFPDQEFITQAEAQQYRQTMTMRELLQKQQERELDARNSFPDEI